MNKELKDRIFDIPENVIDYLKHFSSLSSSDTDGIKRARNLINYGKVTYGQLKKIIHDLKNIDKNKELDKYNLYGGEPMENWGTQTLNNEREFIKDRKKSKMKSDLIGGINGIRKNPFLKKHTKKQSMIPSLNPLKSNSDKNSVSNLKLGKLFEEILNDNKKKL
jgi:hypothetical protein